ncbi:GNAT family N-acetyltransferase [Aquabacterium humicola]|uniref:GNAT family N-acetyltransferase n=1 Tax=Aquabacterium humicola TaxID=3237377 RepID=UPI002543F8B9|nr:GNAT family N-acetyltransferase [Rubrivivax pictus]
MPHPNTDHSCAVRALTAADLDAVVTIDAALEGRSRRDYVERRLAAARREPALHAQFAVDEGGELAAYLLARVLHGEFGRSRPSLRIELVGVRPERRGRGYASALLRALQDWGRRHGADEIHTLAAWTDAGLLPWLHRRGFALAPHHVIESAVDEGRWRPERDGPVSLPPGFGAPAEIDYGRTESNDHERLARDEADVRAMTADDLDAIVRIDRDIVGSDRRDYIAARLAEALHDAAIRISLVARRGGAIVGYLMARADFGDYGRTEPVAVLDTIGVDPAWTQRGVGHALLSQLFANLGALRVERAETVVAQRSLGLLGFLYATGFAPSQRLMFVIPV